MFIELAIFGAMLSSVSRDSPPRCDEDPRASPCPVSITYRVVDREAFVSDGLPWREGLEIDYPSQQYDQGISGVATVACAVAPETGRLLDCGSEDGTDPIFGYAIYRAVHRRSLDRARWHTNTVRIRVEFRRQ